MATTSQTYPSLISTGTILSSSAIPTGNSSDPADSISGLFSSAGSPPLIVAFLSIGLFIIAMVGVFGWKRLLRSRDNQVILPNRTHKSISLGEKPTLWDVWADPKVPGKSHIEARRWENMTPMSATLTFPISPVRPPVDPLPIGSTDPNGHVLFQMLRSSVSAVKRFYLPDPHLPPPPPPQPDEKEAVVSPASDEIEWGDASSLQVSVIITMPTQRQCCSETPDTDPERMELGEFCVGTTDVPWSEGG